MKFVCKHCGSKYTIADEKVRSKVLKIRCKNCAKIIEVRDDKTPRKAKGEATGENKTSRPERSALEGKFAESFRPKKKSAQKGTPGLFNAVKRSAEMLDKKDTDRVHWFVAIDNTPVGPISAKKIHAHQQAGRVGDSSLVWKEGMGDWTALRNCKELIGLLAHLDIEEATASEIDQQQTEKPKEEGPKLGLFAEQEVSAESPLKGRSMGVIAERIDAPVEEEPSKPEIQKEKPQDPLFDLPDSSDIFTSDSERKIGELHALELPLATSQSQNRVIMLASVGFFIVAIATLGIALFGGGDTVETTTVNTVEKIVERVVYRDRPLNDSNAIRISDDAENGSGNNRGRRNSRANRRKHKTEDKKTDKPKNKTLLDFGYKKL